MGSSVVFIGVPDEFQLGLPLEFIVLADVFVNETGHDVSGMRVQSDHAHDLLTQRTF